MLVFVFILYVIALYYIVLYYIILYYPIDACLFCNEKQKGNGSDGRGGGDEQGEVWEGTIIWIYHVRKKIHYQQK